MLLIIFPLVYLVTPRVNPGGPMIPAGQTYSATIGQNSTIISTHIFLMIIGVVLLLLTFRLKHYSIKARNLIVAFYGLYLLLVLAALIFTTVSAFFLILNLVVSLFIIVTLLFHKNLQDLWY